MIDLDYGPLAVCLPLFIAFVFPFVYSFSVDNYDKGLPHIKS